MSRLTRVIMQGVEDEHVDELHKALTGGAMDTPRSKREIARDLIIELLPPGERVPTAEVIEEAERQGVNRRTLGRAARDLGVQWVRNGPLPGWWWRPEIRNEDEEDE